MAPTYPRGSEWRKWDLQVHTPHSALNNGFGADFDAYAAALFLAAVDAGIAVIGVTDYFTIDGYKELRQIQQTPNRLEALVGADAAATASQILLLPNLELRTSVVVSRLGAPDGRVNFHVILSDQLTPEDIEDFFLRELKFTAESTPGSSDERWSLTTENLAALGKRLKVEHPKFKPIGSDLCVGMMNAVVAHEELTAVLERQPSRFAGKYFFAVPADEDLSEINWNGQAHLTRKLLIQKSHMLFSSNPNTRQFGLGGRHHAEKDFLREFKTLKPCVWGSDAHDYERLFRPAEGRQLWVKADPTFEGLRQVLHEPTDRAFIGVIPPSLERLRSRPTKVIDSVGIEPLAESRASESWFSSKVELNGELVAVIGNKGNGKSALADIIGLLGGTSRSGAFGFLTERRFRNPRSNRAKHYVASLKWRDGSTEGPVSLASDPLPEAVEKVRYVPQNFLEEICNEVGLGKDSRFQAELQAVIFSHVSSADKLGYFTLDELLRHKGSEVSAGIQLITRELSELNREVSALENLMTNQHRMALEAQVLEKERELAAHDQRRPKEMRKPDADAVMQEQSLNITGQIDAKRSDLETVDQVLAEMRRVEEKAAKQTVAADRMLTRLRNISRQVSGSITDAAADLAELGLSADDVIYFEVHTDKVDRILADVTQLRATLRDALDPDLPDSTEAGRRDVVAEIDRLQEALSLPERDYQAHLDAIRSWEAARSVLIGSDESVGSLTALKKALDALESIPTKLRSLEKARDRKALEILREKQKLRRDYEYFYGAVQRFLSTHRLARGGAFRLTFEVSMIQSGVAETFLAKINRRKLGFFAGVDEGAAALKRMTDSADWNSVRSALRFARNVVAKLKEAGARDVKDQLILGESVSELYDWLFSFDYVEPIYRLTWDGKGLEQLSPGERGNLLLIFYLLIDRDEIPLVMDQPEENLDNQTVVRTLVPCIKDAKQRRQIIMVTHNPNLAVVCDAEQVIYSELRAEPAKRFSYSSGSIEAPGMNIHLVDVLEGTRPAFDKRDSRYQPLSQ